jgi:hypothetical protein
MPKSLAGSKKNYVKIQIKAKHNEHVWNVQGKGEEVNREYGVAGHANWESLIDYDLVDYLKKMPKHYLSLADNSKEKYFIAYARIVYEENILHMKTYNREYGAQFEIEKYNVNPNVWKFVEMHQRFQDIQKFQDIVEEANGE